MSANPLDEIWSAICDECKKSISEVAFNCFLKDLVPVFLSDGEFTISINDEYKKGVIEQTYLSKLKPSLNSSAFIMSSSSSSKTIRAFISTPIIVFIDSLSLVK